VLLYSVIEMVRARCSLATMSMGRMEALYASWSSQEEHLSPPLVRIAMTLHVSQAPRSIRNRSNEFEKNITKRGNVALGKAEKHTEERPISKILIVFFLVVVVGSSLVQVFNLFGKSPAKPPKD
jgi:Ribosome associated membrane protein RAMP4